MKQTNLNFEKLNPEQKREVREESELYIEKDPRAEHVHTKMGTKPEDGRNQNATSDMMQDMNDRGPSAEKNREPSNL